MQPGVSLGPKNNKLSITQARRVNTLACLPTKVNMWQINVGSQHALLVKHFIPKHFNIIIADICNLIYFSLKKKKLPKIIMF